MNRTINNYTGIAKPVCDKNGNYSLVACTYEKVGMYATCVKMEGGKIIAIGLGGFKEETAFSEEAKGEKSYQVTLSVGR